MRANKRKAFTLMEMLIALTILSLVLMLASKGIITVLRMHRTQEATTLTQTKIRRVSEVISQEVRGAILGGLADSPYPASDTSLSFALINGGAGYPVTAISSGAVEIVAQNLAAGDLQVGDNIMVTNKNGDSFIASINAINGTVKHTISFNNCVTGVSYTPNSLLYKVKSIGYNYNPITKTLNYKIANQAQQPVAFDISNFQISYIYSKSDGTTITLNSPLLAAGIPQKYGQIAGDDVSLVRLKLDMTAEAKDAAEHTISRSYSSQIGLVDTTVGAGKNVDNSEFVKVKGIKVCN